MCPEVYRGGLCLHGGEKFDRRIKDVYGQGMVLTFLMLGFAELMLTGPEQRTIIDRPMPGHKKVLIAFSGLRAYNNIVECSTTTAQGEAK